MLLLYLFGMVWSFFILKALGYETGVSASVCWFWPILIAIYLWDCYMDYKWNNRYEGKK